ncbi:sigma-70 family RNA polymerase sigma factor [Colwellia sp. UCD-KL20]|uniref:RNA polymerase sigma factor n=1 Tax=Colwellia sp. UCD-KL20 TaxID=1917165 RepID=UPI000970F356|nr:sigma-70 family RNA polymerase sigma factor [Colwellia sp. UCD-KL20]
MAINNHTDLIELAQQGDQNAFTQLVIAHQQLIRAYIAARIRHPQDVDDLAQETFILAFKKLSELQHTKALQSWLCGIALNLVRNHYRKFNPTAEGDEGVLNNLITDELEKSIELEKESISISALKACLSQLSEDLKQMLVMHYQENHSVKVLTQTYQLKHSTITMRLHRTRKVLQKCIMDKLSREES